MAKKVENRRRNERNTIESLFAKNGVPSQLVEVLKLRHLHFILYLVIYAFNVK